ncbi:hypothetical protein NEAUS05_1897, partial [Nematocida ausubeli]
MSFSVIWIKAVALISTLLINISRADISLSEIQSTLQFEITTDLSQVKINPEGPLNFLRGYIYHKMELMHNKRFFAPQIDTYYNAGEDPKYPPDTFDKSLYTRDKKQDKAYTVLKKNGTDMYLEKYHTHLIDLFPSHTGDITIEARGNQSFVQFLRAKTTEKHSLQILAMLLLFSEGVNIPIKVNNSLLEVYEKDEKDEIYFKVSMRIPWFDSNLKKEVLTRQRAANQIISFFEANATNCEVFNMLVDRCSQDEVATGKFLDSLKFLIQTYIFGFIDSAKRATEFIQTVHSMTEKYAPKTEAPIKGNSVYDRLFKPASVEAEIDCAVLMKDTQDILNTYRAFPFADNTQLPAYTSVPFYNRESTSFSKNSLESYSNCVECSILSLFCCLTYDPSDFLHKTDHMGNVSDELKDFFSTDKQPFFTTKIEFQEKWCAVVADIKNLNILYRRDRNELYPGILNMLMVIAEIVNAPEDEKDKIVAAMWDLYDGGGYLTNTLSENIKDYTEEVFKRLSKTENIQVNFSDLQCAEFPGNVYDLVGEITVVFEHTNVKNTIVLTITDTHSAIKMEPTVMKVHDDRLERMNRIANTSRDRETFIENLLTMYVDYEARKIDTPENSNEFMRSQVCKTIENNFTDINRLLLMKKISDYNY